MNNNSKIGDDIPVGHGPTAIAMGGNVYVANFDSDSVSVIDMNNNSKIGNDIPVGDGPTAIAIDTNVSPGKIYVANDENASVSVIDGNNNSKIDHIPVGESPNAIAIGIDKVYVTNYYGDSVSVIDSTNNSKIDHIPVGESPVAILEDHLLDKVYVVNQANNSVSVIDSTNNSKIYDIPVGESPSAIAYHSNTNTIYVTNSGDNTLSVIDGKTNKIVTKIMFNIEPYNAGHIECDKDKLIAPTEQQFYVYSGTQCTAKPNQGFEFVNWQENLVGNSTQLLQFSPPNTWYSTLKDGILDFFHMKRDKTEATLEIKKFGSFTANFKALPPPIPSEHVATLFAVVISAFIGSWLTPTIVEWQRSRKQGGKLDYYHNELKSLYNDGRLNRNDIEKLDALNNDIDDDYSKGKINKEQYDRLGDEISVRYRKIVTDKIDVVKNLSPNEKVKQVSEIKNIIEDAHAEGKINELHYSLLKERLSDL